MKVIHFPGNDAVAVTGVTNPDPNTHLALSPVSFTCSSCGENTSAEFHNMVFRSLEFYCLSCGHPFRVVNPAFSRLQLK